MSYRISESSVYFRTDELTAETAGNRLRIERQRFYRLARLAGTAQDLAVHGDLNRTCIGRRQFQTDKIRHPIGIARIQRMTEEQLSRPVYDPQPRRLQRT